MRTTEPVGKELASFIGAMRTIIGAGRNIDDLSSISLFSRDIIEQSLAANLIVTNKQRTWRYCTYISNDIMFAKPGFLPDAGLTISGSREAWLEVFRGERSLLSKVASDEFFVPNIRTNFGRVLLLSNLFTCCAEKNH
jgi:hypothetical protein